MKWLAMLIPVLLLGGCSRASMPNLEDVPPAAQASINAPATGNASGDAQASNDAQEQTSDAQAVAGSAVAVELTAQQRSDIERGVQRALADSNFAKFGPMTATISRFTSQGYIVCGWVKPGDSSAGYEPFVAMYVPKMRHALLIGVGGRQPQDAIRQRCIAEGAPLKS